MNISMYCSTYAFLYLLNNTKTSSGVSFHDLWKVMVKKHYVPQATIVGYPEE
jgi:hypothetical protein